MKKIILLLTLIYTFSLPVSAREIPDLSKTGSISITMRYNGHTVSGGEMTIYLVGTISEADGNYNFALNKTFAASGLSLENIHSPSLARNLHTYARNQKITGLTQKISTGGTVNFGNLQPALYLLVQQKAAPGYECAEPFLVSVPMGLEDVYIYDVDASPKLSPLEQKEPERTEIPKTGQSRWPFWTFGISALALTTLLRKKKTV